MLRNQAVLQADFIVVLRADGQHREEGGSSLSLSISLFLLERPQVMSGCPSSESRGPALGIPASRRIASGLRLGEFAIFKNLCHCAITASDMAKANTLYLPFKSIAGTKSRFSGRGQDRK